MVTFRGFGLLLTIICLLVFIAISMLIYSFPAADRSSLAQILTNIFGFAVAALVVVWQMGKHNKLGLELQAENTKNSLKIDVYQKITEALRVASSPIAETFAWCVQTQTSVKLYLGNPDKFMEILQYQDLSPETLLKLSKSISDSVGSVVIMLEDFELVVPANKVFRYALLSALHDIRENSDLFLTDLLAWRSLIHHVSNEQIEPNEIVPSAMEVLTRVRSSSEKFFRIVSSIDGYLYDLRVLTQNVLLGSLFGNQVDVRKPLDPSEIVITNDPKHLKELEQFFYAETAWGKRCNEAHNEVSERFSLRSN